MKREEMSQLDRVEMKLDFIFGIMSNDTMATEFLQAFHGEREKGKKADEVIVNKAEEMFKYHHKNVKDSITYFVELFGKESNDRIHEIILDIQKEAETEPEATADVKTASAHTSEKVD